MQTESNERADRPLPTADKRSGGLEPDFDRPARPVGELLADADFPKSALGELIDIGGYTGVVIDVVNQSLKVKSPEGATKSFNANGLRKLYGPRLRPDPVEESTPTPPVKPAPMPDVLRAEKSVLPLPVAPKREVINEPDFSKPVRKIAEFVGRPDYPKCVYGEHVEIGGFVGVVVEIVHRSLKVRSKAETTRSYNADALRRLGNP
jgi:hypothetical protein